jgi:superoxide reductase
MATEQMQVYKCEVCGIVAEVLDGGAGNLVCCGQQMVRMSENMVDASREKHLPVVERTPEGIRVSVGAVAHPMEAKHFIQWVELQAGKQLCRHYFKPGDKPQALFSIDAGNVVRSYCNLHGLWKA